MRLPRPPSLSLLPALLLLAGCFGGAKPRPAYTLEATLPQGREAPLTVEASGLDVRMASHLRGFTEAPLRFAPDGTVTVAPQPRFYAPLDALAADTLRRSSRFTGTTPLRITIRDFALRYAPDGTVTARVTLAAPGRAPALAEAPLPPAASPAEIAQLLGRLLGQAYTALTDAK